MHVPSPILAPIVALVAWSMIMWLWMYAPRLPAMARAKMKPDPNAPRGEQMNQLPANVRWKADNYNHLMEQPTIFYAVAFALALLGIGGGINLTLAWAVLLGALAVLNLALAALAVPAGLLATAGWPSPSCPTSRPPR